MFVWSSFRSRRRTAAPHDELHAETLAGLGTRRRWAGYGLCVFQTRPIKVGNTHVDFTQKAFERAGGRAMLGWLDWGILPVAHQVGCTVKC